jgi:hypothetical protein
VSEEINYAKTDWSHLLDQVVALLKHYGMEKEVEELKKAVKQATNNKEYLSIVHSYADALLGKDYLSLGILDIEGLKEEKKWLEEKNRIRKTRRRR